MTVADEVCLYAYFACNSESKQGVYLRVSAASLRIHVQGPFVGSTWPSLELSEARRIRSDPRLAQC